MVLRNVVLNFIAVLLLVPPAFPFPLLGFALELLPLVGLLLPLVFSRPSPLLRTCRAALPPLADVLPALDDPVLESPFLSFSVTPLP